MSNYNDTNNNTIKTFVVAILSLLLVGLIVGFGTYFGLKNTEPVKPNNESKVEVTIVDGDFNEYLNNSYYSAYERHLKDLPLNISIKNNGTLVNKYLTHLPEAHKNASVNWSIFDTSLWRRNNIDYDSSNPNHKLNVYINGELFDFTKQDYFLINYKDVELFIDNSTSSSSQFDGLEINANNYDITGKVLEVTDSLDIVLDFTVPVTK